MNENEVAVRLGVTRNTLNNLIYKGRLRVVDVKFSNGKRVRILQESDVIYYESYIKARTNVSSMEAYLNRMEANYRNERGLSK